MERLTINIPEWQSEEIKSFLKSKGILMERPKALDMDAYREKIANIGAWAEDDIKLFEENRRVLDSFNPQEWWSILAYL